MKRFLEIAKIVATQGVRGEVRCQYYCDAPEVLCGFDELYLDKGAKPVRVLRAYPHKNVVIMRIEGVDTVEKAQAFIGKLLYIDRNDAELGEDLYFIQDIIGLTVKDIDTGEVYGKISEVYQNGAADVYSIKKENGAELMFPCVDEVVKKIDVEGGEMLIKPLKGLFDSEDAQ
ncbi:MAG: ribosome maturation factor RimM [Lachnospiraceae bacterium]|nr:ribosome maturation factor RimM [Ruminococcus sp.]MCM1274365.1 ribosome maturation factor RimM [Lachnospiraceae bacterium]